MAEVIQFIEENLPLILCLLFGAALLVVEVFMPGFGLPGISGLVLLIVGITLTWLHYGPAAGLSARLRLVDVVNDDDGVAAAILHFCPKISGYDPAGS